MTMKPESVIGPSAHNPSGFGLGLARLVWTILGPLLLVGAIVASAGGSRTWFDPRDALPALVLAGMILCRWLEQRTGKATTAYGSPSTFRDFQIWATIAIGVAVFGWVAANIISNHVLG